MAEKQLENIRDSLRVVSDIQNMDDINPIVTRISNSTVRRVQTVVCAVREPFNEILPLNVVWFDFNPLSAYYNEARRRVSKDPSIAAGTNHTWEVIDTMLQFNEDQFYDDEDAAILAQDDPMPVASFTKLGIARLSVAPVDGAKPIAVGEGDKRLSDARVPTEHSHAEKPANQLKTKSGSVTIGSGVAPVVGATMIYNGTSVNWRQLTSTDIAK
jgi:hypothetical protein